MLSRRAFFQTATGVVTATALQNAGGSPQERYQRAAQERTPHQPIDDANGTLTGMLVVAPSIVSVHETFTLNLRILTRPYAVPLNCFSEYYPAVESSTNLSPRGIRFMDNTPPRWTGELILDGGSAFDGPTRLTVDDTGRVYPHDERPIRRVSGLRFRAPGVYTLRVTDERSGITGSSNPVRVTSEPPRERLFWGDIHGHTIFTDAIRAPEEIYYFARDESFLDVCAITEHAEYYLTEYQWQYFQHVTNSFNQPNRFVTLVAQEWTNMKYGHRNLYYNKDNAPLVRATDPSWSELPSIYALARQHGALVVPHHSASAVMGVDWNVDHDPEVERLVEVYSVWGNSERAAAAGNFRPIHDELGGEKSGQHVVDALKLGRKFGILASGDFHDGRPGNTLGTYQQEPPAYRYGQPGGLVGIWAPTLTRESIFDALWNRRVFGTTGPRILLTFELGGAPMGSELPRQQSYPLRVEVSSEVPVQQVDLVRGGEDYASVTPGTGDVTWTLDDVPGSGCYYVRITREDGEMAWSSPIWIQS